MDILSVVAWLLVLLGATIIYWYATIPKNLPPGPSSLPFLGNSLDYLKGDKQHLLAYENMRKYGPVFRLYMAEQLVVVLCDYETIQEALVHQGDAFGGRPQTFSFISHELKNSGIAMSEGQVWKELRRFALSTLRDLGLGRPVLEPHIKEEIDHLAEMINTNMISFGSFDPHEPFTCAFSNVISQMIFGRRFNYDDREFVHFLMAMSERISDDGVGAISPFLLSGIVSKIASVMPAVQKFREDGDKFARFTERSIRQTIDSFDPKSEPTNYVHAYMKAVNDEKVDRSIFTNKQLLATVLDLFVGGTETTSTTLRCGLLYLATFPEMQERMVAEMRDVVGSESPDYADRTKLPYCEAVCIEIQRIANIIPFGVHRRTLAKTKLHGYDIPEDTIVVPFLMSVLRDEKMFPDSGVFKPERFLDSNGKVTREPKMIPFQTGKRVCLGESLARMELFLFVTGLLTRFRFYFPTDQPRPSLKPIFGIGQLPQPYKICAAIRKE